jgi:hypothetical protein
VPIANLRHVEWRSLGINFVMVFSPGTFRGADLEAEQAGELGVERDLRRPPLLGRPPRAVGHPRAVRGRITALNGVPASRIKAAEEAAWVLDGDRGITYAEDRHPLDLAPRRGGAEEAVEGVGVAARNVEEEQVRGAGRAGSRRPRRPPGSSTATAASPTPRTCRTARG